ncbi:MAG: GGDEF domain-containing protein, partial [Candidatus Latescibacteria bacterium]|nr:GGDEF domain-containing protein [Candidatus Latescibacterota bacterium]
QRLRDPTDRELYGEIVDAYENLIKVARRLVRVGDHLSGDLREASSLDPLTRVANRRRFLDLAKFELARAQRYGHSTAVLIMDLDHFKAINDTYGHPAGDAVLRQSADIMKERLREIDSLGRWGGEEFVALLPETDQDGASLTAMRLCQSMERATFEHDGRTIPCTVSIGATTTGQSAAEIDALIGLADRALYRAKEAGRNRVACSWDEAL